MNSTIIQIIYNRTKELQKLWNPPKELEELQLLQTVPTKWWLVVLELLTPLSITQLYVLPDTNIG